MSRPVDVLPKTGAGLCLRATRHQRDRRHAANSKRTYHAEEGAAFASRCQPLLQPHPAQLKMKRATEPNGAPPEPASKAAKTGLRRTAPGCRSMEEEQQNQTLLTNKLKRGPASQEVPDLQASPKRARVFVRYLYDQEGEEDNKENQTQELLGAEQFATQPSSLTCSQPRAEQSCKQQQQPTAVQEEAHAWRSPVPLHKAGNLAGGMDTPWGLMTPPERCTSGASREQHRASSKSPLGCGSGSKVDLFGRFSKLELSFSSSFRTDPVYGMAASNRTSSGCMTYGSDSLGAQRGGSVGCTGIVEHHLSTGSSCESGGRSSAPATAPTMPAAPSNDKHVQVSIRCFVRPLAQSPSGSASTSATVPHAAVTITPIVTNASHIASQQAVTAARASQPEPDMICAEQQAPAVGQVPGAGHRFRQLTFSNSLALHYQAKQQICHPVTEAQFAKP